MLRPLWLLLPLALATPDPSTGFEEEEVGDGLPAPAGDGVLELNVGGTLFTTLRSTLRAQESILSAVVSGEWGENAWTRDEEGRFFLDLDPEPFELLLGYLRTQRHMPKGRKARPPVVPTEMRQSFDTMCQYFGFEDPFAVPVASSGAGAGAGVFSVADAALEFLPYGGSGGGTLEAESTALVTRAHFSMGSAVAKEALLPVSESSRYWTLKLGSGKGEFAVGVTCNTVRPFEREHKSTTYGWADGRIAIGGTWHFVRDDYRNRVRASETARSTGWEGWQGGDFAVFKIDAQARTLQLYLRRLHERFTLRLDGMEEAALQGLRLWVNMRGRNFRAEFGAASAQEVAEADF